MRLILLSILQSALAVGGMGLMTMAMHGRPNTITDLISGALSPQGLLGMLLLITSFVVMAIILTFAKLSVYVPLNTGIAFLFTIIFATVIEHERVNVPMIIGMALILSGIAVLSNYRIAQ